MPRGWVAPSAWTLRAKLVASMLALFAIITVLTSAVSVTNLDRFLTGQIDDQLQSSVTRLLGAPGDGDEQGFGGRPERRGPGESGIALRITGDSAYRLVGTQSVTNDQLALLTALPANREPRNVDLGGTLGDYRVLATQTSTGKVVVGLPRARQAGTVANAWSTALLAGLLGLLVMGAAGIWLVRRNLRPLNAVADTATRVSRLHLASGQVSLADRVPVAYTDPRTEVGKVGQALNEMLDHVDEALTVRQASEQRVRQFVADASHELRTPLASIRGYTELTKREPEPVPAGVQHALGRVEAEAHRMSALVEDLLLLARLDAGRPLEREPVDLSELVVNAVSDAHAASPAHAWELDLPEEPVTVIGDQARLHQVVANLLANARVHTLPGTRVRVGLSPEPGRVRITVHDNGPGVPQHLQPDVFQRFARGDSARNRAGGSTGLGLSIVAAVAGAHGGSVELTSRPGDTTFAVLLPDTPQSTTAAAPAWTKGAHG